MPSFFLTLNSSNTATPAAMGTETGAFAVIGRAATVGFLNGSVIVGSGSNQSASVLGAAVSGIGDAISMDGANADVTVAASGTVMSLRAAGIDLGLRSAAQTGQITNAGEVTGVLGIDVAGSVAIENSGRIVATGQGVSTASPLSNITAAIHLSDPFANFVYSALVSNTGEIAAAVNAAGTHFAGRRMAVYDGQGVISGGGGATTTVENDGIIRGDIWLGKLADRVDNTGRIVGRVDMGTGNDLVDNAGRITGSVLLGDGRDVYRAGQGGEVLGSIDGGADVDVLVGGARDDVLRGGTGGDILTGGGGADAFVYRSAAESTSGARDTITDFRRAGADRIDLSAIDARALTPQDDSFTFIGNAPLTTAQGRLGYNAATGVLSAEINGEAGADLVIVLSNRPVLTAADFIL
jgi:Ca2+-binding RTX toxin-like protein